MEVAPGIYSLGNHQGGRVRAYLLDDGQGITVVDTLMAADARLILAELAPLGTLVKVWDALAAAGLKVNTDVPTKILLNPE